jgi:hypothetical protein
MLTHDKSLPGLWPGELKIGKKNIQSLFYSLCNEEEKNNVWFPNEMVVLKGEILCLFWGLKVY